MDNVTHALELYRLVLMIINIQTNTFNISLSKGCDFACLNILHAFLLFQWCFFCLIWEHVCLLFTYKHLIISQISRIVVWKHFLQICVRILYPWHSETSGPRVCVWFLFLRVKKCSMRKIYILLRIILSLWKFDHYLVVYFFILCACTIRRLQTGI